MADIAASYTTADVEPNIVRLLYDLDGKSTEKGLCQGVIMLSLKGILIEANLLGLHRHFFGLYDACRFLPG